MNNPDTVVTLDYTNGMILVDGRPIAENAFISEEIRVKHDPDFPNHLTVELGIFCNKVEVEGNPRYYGLEDDAFTEVYR
ncbi:hypothetical protein SEA_KEELAN_142 [Gordonia phage Keelan]|nr:hypothetical protein SEA_KEELAN_142 [Gordonia phage Keelan]